MESEDLFDEIHVIERHYDISTDIEPQGAQMTCCEQSNSQLGSTTNIDHFQSTNSSLSCRVTFTPPKPTQKCVVPIIKHSYHGCECCGISWRWTPWDLETMQ